MTGRTWRILYNQDCTNLFGFLREPITPAHVDHMIDEVADAGADCMLINPNAQRANFPSRAWQTFWDGYTPGDRAFFGPVDEASIPARERWIVQMKRLADGGCDYLARSLARCRARGIVPGISIRMNDMHDAPELRSHLFSDIYRQHPEWLLSTVSDSGRASGGLNYACDGVRAHFLALVREFCERYDFDVLELDFMRFADYFPCGEGVRLAPVMTGFIREVRTELDRTGRRIELIPRVAAHPAAALELGFDVGAWAREGLVDGLSFGAFFTTVWHTATDDFRHAVGPELPLYPSCEHAVDERQGMEKRLLSMEARWVHGYAAAQHAAGADGMHLFNFFIPRDMNPDWTPCFDAIRGAKDPEGLRGKRKSYAIGDGGMACDGAGQTPVTVPWWSAREFRMTLAAEPAGTPVTVSFIVTGEGLRDTTTVRLFFNNMPLGVPDRVDAEPGKEGSDLRAARFDVPAEALREGENILRVWNTGAAFTVVGVDVNVGN